MTQSETNRPKNNALATPSFCGPVNNNSSASRTCFSRRASNLTFVRVINYFLPREVERPVREAPVLTVSGVSWLALRRAGAAGFDSPGSAFTKYTSRTDQVALRRNLAFTG